MPDRTEGKLGDVAGIDGDRPSAAGPEAGGSRPSETGPGATGGTATGGKAVPDNDSLMGGESVLGDAGSLDDGRLNSGDSLAEESRAVSGPHMSEAGKDKATENADAPTGGLGGTSSVG